MSGRRDLHDTSERELPRGTRLLDRYVILDRYDGGGMATIYRAEDERLSRVVVAKVLRTTLVEGSGSTSGRALYHATYTHFLDEARALSKLQHPSTLRIYDFGYVGDASTPTEERSPFHISEFLSGGNLEQRVRAEGTLSPLAAADVLDAVAGALGEAHGYGIVHRDVKPSNILFAEVGAKRFPKIADFGIARTPVPTAEAAKTGRTPSTPLTLCSPRWAAPEQLSSGVESATTDVYSLGLVAHFMLTGRPAFDSARIRETYLPRIFDDDFATRAIRASGLPTPLEEVILACLRVSPAQRFHSPAAFATAFRAAAATLDGGPPPPRATAAPREPQPPASAGPTSAGGTGPVTMSLVPEVADLAFAGGGTETRVRLSFQPTSSRVNVRNLSGFVVRDGARPSTAVLLDRDATLTFMTSSQAVRLVARLAFGERTADGTVFLVDGQPVLIPFSTARQAVALYVTSAAGHTPQVVIVGRT
jgi:serine/threonine-protein kinase